MIGHVRSACLYCGGYGIVHNDDELEVPCVECEGTGINWVKDEDYEEEKPLPKDYENPDVLPTDK
jgi:hypothetical protein